MKASKLTRRATLLVLTAVLLFPFGLSANNIRITSTPTIAKKNDSVAAITFTLAWDNSWKSSKPANWDAAWIYVKCWDGDQWNHAYLADTGHVAGNPDATGYSVTSRDGTKKKQELTYEMGKSMVYKKWHIDPAETAVVGNVGLFLYRKEFGAGNVNIPGITLLWNYVNQGFSSDDDLVVKVFAVEMVYVPKGAFYLGGVGASANHVASFTYYGMNFGYPYNVTSENSITLSNSTSTTTLCTTASSLSGSLPAAFPKGYQAFYIMKYELTQEAYADFLNTLNQGQQDGRIQGTLANINVGGSMWDGNANALCAFRNYVEVSQRAPTVTFGVDANNNNRWNEVSSSIGIDGQDLAMNFVSMYDLLAYADFAGLRPMTELEYEKACRGDRPVAANEYAWGSATATWFAKSFHTTTGSYFVWNTGAITNINRGDERVAATYNCGVTRSGTWEQQQQGTYWWNYQWRNRRGIWTAPLRVGCFATGTTTRAAAGATYWGVMNMTDNCSELCISVQNTGRNFVGVHGDGQLLSNGNADVADWRMTTSWDYYIPRGAVWPTPDWLGWTGWSAWAVNGGKPTADQHAARINIDELPGSTGGQISGRDKWSHGIAGTVREWRTFMPGIRCVRTANAAK